MRMFLALILLLLPALARGEEHRPPNHLLGEASPYLQQHLYNPVDWYPWGQAALDKARREGKMVFLSIGYSACHWCHVMEAESFENPEIAAFLNAHFVSIKVDREERPDLDEQYMLVTQALTGGGGWPNSVFLTSEGEPFYAGGYYPPDVFLEVLGRLETEWRTNAEGLKVEARGLGDYIREYMSKNAAARDVGAGDIAQAARNTLERIDFFSGGLEGSVKFPQESFFLFLQDAARRSDDAEMQEAVTVTLDGMLAGGIYDNVGGGFHRYATDPEWQVPHFEKMLYNQALTGRLLLRAWQDTGEERYRFAAQQTLDYVLREMRDPAGGFYAAQDADSLDALGEMREGAYYIWTPAQIRAAVAGGDAARVIETFGVVEAGDFDGQNILRLAAWPADTDWLARMETALRMARENRPAPFTDRKIVVALNGAMIATLAEAGYVLARPDYSAAAGAAADFILTEMRPDGQLRSRSIDGIAAIDAHLTDYAALGLALVALHDYAPDAESRAKWLRAAEEIAAGMAQFREGDGSYRMRAEVDGLGRFRPLEDSELPAGNAQALALYAALAQRTANPDYANAATLLQAAIAGGAYEAPVLRAYTLKAAADFIDGETGPLRYVSGGVVRVEARHVGGVLQLDIRLRDGWHINAHEPLDEYFVPTDLRLNGTAAGAEIYTAPVIKTLGFSPDPLALYEGNLRLTTPFAGGLAELELQACSDEVCLSPELLRFRIR